MNIIILLSSLSHCSAVGLCWPSNRFNRSSVQSSVFEANDVRAPVWMLPGPKGFIWSGQYVQLPPQQKAGLAVQQSDSVFWLSVHARFASLRGQVSDALAQVSTKWRTAALILNTDMKAADKTGSLSVCFAPNRCWDLKSLQAQIDIKNKKGWVRSTSQ